MEEEIPGMKFPSGFLESAPSIGLPLSFLLPLLISDWTSTSPTAGIFTKLPYSSSRANNVT